MKVATQFSAVASHDDELRFRATFEGAAIGIAICDLDGRIREANPALARLLGYNPWEVVGGEACVLDLKVPVESGDTKDDSHSWIAELIRGEREPLEIEKCYRRNDGSSLQAHLTVSLGRNAGGQPSFLIVLLTDAGRPERAEELGREAEKMQAIGRMAGGIAHDFNNLLTGILLYCDLLSSGLESGGFGSAELAAAGLTEAALASVAVQRSGLCQEVDEVRMASEHGAAMTRQLLAIARKQEAIVRPIAINEIVQSTQAFLRRLLGEKVELVVTLDARLDSADDATGDGAKRVLADPSQLQQILLNLLLNARDAMPHGGKIHLNTRVSEMPRTKVNGQVEPARTRPAVVLAVKDEGHGMDSGTLARVFELYFTTKHEGAGTGLGLCTVKRIVTEIGGVIEIESEPGRGTSIEVFLPAVEHAAG